MTEYFVVSWPKGYTLSGYTTSKSRSYRRDQDYARVAGLTFGNYEETDLEVRYPGCQIEGPFPFVDHNEAHTKAAEVAGLGDNAIYVIYPEPVPEPVPAPEEEEPVSLEEAEQAFLDDLMREMKGE